MPRANGFHPFHMPLLRLSGMLFGEFVVGGVAGHDFAEKQLMKVILRIAAVLDLLIHGIAHHEAVHDGLALKVQAAFLDDGRIHLLSGHSGDAVAFEFVDVAAGFGAGHDELSLELVVRGDAYGKAAGLR